MCGAVPHNPEVLGDFSPPAIKEVGGGARQQGHHLDHGQGYHLDHGRQVGGGASKLSGGRKKMVPGVTS
jgi:hypothetical protein